LSEPKLTMKDIAEIAGVGKSTVSRYFNGGLVKPETKEKLRQICEKYNYKPNQAAKLLKAKRTNTVGIISPTLTSYTSSVTITAMDDYLKDRGFRTIIINTNHSPSREKEAFEYLTELNVDGIIILATNNKYNYEELKEEYQIPILFMGQEIEKGPSIVYDDYRSGLEVGNLIAESGHKDIVFLGVDESDVSVGVVRKLGVYDALKKHNLNDIDYIQADFEYEKCLPIVEEYLDKHVPSAIICSTDRMASACYTILQNRNIKIPEDVSIIGFGSYRYSRLMNPPLDSIRFDNHKAGEECAQTILEMIEGIEVDYRKLIGFEYVHGGSIRKI
jgi:LacI family transcriptional regulator, sucrose operon repressor